MTPFDALAAAIRERLTSGRPAPLPGLGTLVRQHVSARVEERGDGTRVLLPPGETIGLAPTTPTHESLAPTFGRLLALPDAEAQRAYAEAADQLEARLAATGEVRLPGVGLLRRTSGGVILGVEADLLAAVNRAYEGLSPVGPSRDADSLPPTPPDVLPSPDWPPDGEAGQPTLDPTEAPLPPGEAEGISGLGAPPDAEADPFMIGLPPVDLPEPEAYEPDASDAPVGGLGDDEPEPLPADELNLAPPLDPEPPAPWESEALGAPDDEALDAPVTADASEFDLEPPFVADADLANDPNGVSDAEDLDDALRPADPGEFAGGSTFMDPDEFADPSDFVSPSEFVDPSAFLGAEAGAPADDETDLDAPDPTDAGDLTTEPLFGSDLLPDALEPPEPPVLSPLDSADEPPPAPAPDDVQDGLYVDDDTLDADLDDVLAVPFGRPEDDSPAEVLPPSAPDDAQDIDPDVDADRPEAEPSHDEDDWVADTWTAAASAPPPVNLGDGDSVLIEDAELVEDEIATGAAEDEASVAAPGDADTEEIEPVVVPSASEPDDDVAAPLGPDDEFESLLMSPPAGPPPVVVSDEPPAPMASEGAPPVAPRRPWGWLLGLLLLASIVVAALWLWPRFAGRTDAPAEIPVEEGAPAVLSPAPADRLEALDEEATDDTLAAAAPATVTSGTAPGPSAATAPSTSAPDTPAPAEAAPAPARRGDALPGPRLDGLDDGDRRALTGAPIDPAMGGWTLVVASLRSEAAATALMSRYRQAGYRTAVFAPSGRTVSRYRVGVGQFGSNDHARRLLDRVFEYEPGGTWPLDLRTL